MWAYGAGLFALLLGIYFVVPAGLPQDLVYSGFGLACVLCIVIGLRVHRPAAVRPWLALATANLLMAIGDGILNYYDAVLHHDAPFPSIADGLYLMGYPFLIAAVAGLCRGQRSRPEDYVDSAIVTCGAAAILWQSLMHSYAHDWTLSVFGRLVTMAYPVMDIGVLFLVVGSALAGRLRRPSLVAVGASLVAMLIADLAFDVMVLHDSYAGGSPIDAGWLISYALFGVAALHPSMASKGPRRGAGGPARVRLPLVAAAGFITPILLILDRPLGLHLDLPVVGAVSFLLFALVVLRASWLLRQLYHQTLRLRAQSKELKAALAAAATLEADLRHQAFHDSLTGLANRALLIDRLDHALISSARSAGEVAVLFCDVDDFKTINDGGGQRVGDELLRLIAGRLRSVVRPGDTVARVGGDEFAVLLDAVAQPEVATTTADRIVSVLRQPIELNGEQWRVSVSVGVAFGGAEATAEGLVSEADSAMSAAKAAGKDQARCFETEMRVAVVKRMALRNSFESALADGQFRLVYQPHFDLRDGSLQGFEALVRWQHPVYGTVSPLEFIALAEQTGFIVPLGQWVLDTACTFAVELARQVHSLSMSVNVSVRQLRGDAFVDAVRTTLSYTGLNPRRLTLEVTESMLTEDPAATAETLAGLKRLGTRIAIDDFGTGYSSLSYLSRFPIDVLKIDKSFVDPLDDPGRSGAAFIRTIVGLAQQLGLSTIAEGIETDQQRDLLAELGCELGQGYLMARPMSAEDALALAGARPVGRPAGIGN